MLHLRDAKEKVMSFIEMIKLVEELLAVFQELKADGTIDKLFAAEQALQAEMAQNTKLKELMDRLAHLKK